MNQEKSATSNVTPAIKGSLHASRFFALVALALVIISILVFAARPKQHFFVDPPSGGSVEVFPLNEPNVTPSALIKWATQAAISAYTIDFYSYKDNIDALREYFTVAGYQAYLKSLEDSDSLNKIISDSLVLSAVATDTAVILSEGDTNGVYSWQIQVPLLLTYQGASTNSMSKKIVVGLLVTRVPTDEAPKGIGIAQIVDGDLNG